MALADKQYNRIFSTTGSDADRVDSNKLTRMQAKFDNNEYLEDNDSFETLAPLLYQIQKMQDELDEIRRHVKNDIVGTQGPKGDTGATGATGAAGANGRDGTTPTMTDLDGSRLPTSSRGLSSGKLYNDRGIVKIA
tara:strand:- start:644 stop:1051 length:408 start_codon:yes stop_codon:yes gene_type:complete